MSEEEKKRVELVIPPRLLNKGLGQLGELTGALFGLTVGLMDQLDMKEEAQVIADEQFVKQIGGWNLILPQDGTLVISKIGLYGNL